MLLRTGRTVDERGEKKRSLKILNGDGVPFPDGKRGRYEQLRWNGGG